MSESKSLDSIWKDLADWQTEINKKDEALLRRKAIHDQTLPPVRPSAEIILDNVKPVGLDLLSIKKVPTKAATPTASKPVSKTLAEKAEAEKAKGNEYFGKKDYKNAITYYGKAIDLDPTVPIYFVNRAMAYLKINSFLEAEKDCTRGIQLQPKNVKALWRRGIALRELGRINEARRDFEMGLTIEPSNKSLLDELKKLPAAKISEKKTESSMKNEPVAKEQKRRLPINVIDEAYTGSKINTQQPTKSVKVQETPIPVKKSTAIKMHESKAKTAARTTPEVKSASSSSSAPKMVPAITTSNIKEITPSNSLTEGSPITKPVVAPPTVAAAAKPSASIHFTCPRTNFEFERDWKTFKGRGDDILYQYFQCIPPSSYATIFKSSLESDQFEKMIELVASRYVKEKTGKHVFDILEGLSQVNRIDMLIMFLDKEHQQAIQRLFDVVKESNDVPKDKSAKIAKIYSAHI